MCGTCVYVLTALCSVGVRLCARVLVGTNYWTAERKGACKKVEGQNSLSLVKVCTLSDAFVTLLPARSYSSIFEQFGRGSKFVTRLVKIFL